MLFLKLLFSRWRSLVCQLYAVFFQFFSRGIRMYIPILAGVQKGHYSGQEHGYILLKNVLFQINFLVESQLYANCYFHVADSQILSFLVLKSWDTHGHLHPKRGSKWTDNLLIKMVVFWWKIFFFMVIFQDQCHLYINCFFYSKFLTDIPILTGVQNWHNSG